MRQIGRSLVVAAAFALAGAAPALADVTDSSNWAGYAVHRAGVAFRSVVAAWTEPSASCVPGAASYSAVWTGIGGFNGDSPALDQIGTEIDCGSDGTVQSSAWYELVPAPSQDITMSVRPGDRMLAAVKVRNRQVELSLADLTTHASFTRSFGVRAVDASAAEWIVEAPSSCSPAGNCQTLPLANFGTVSFNLASAASTGGHAGSISDPAWTATAIRLRAGRRHGLPLGHRANQSLGAAPSGVTAGGSAFSVSFGPLPVNAARFLALRRF